LKTIVVVAAVAAAAVVVVAGMNRTKRSALNPTTKIFQESCNKLWNVTTSYQSQSWRGWSRKESQHTLHIRARCDGMLLFIGRLCACQSQKKKEKNQHIKQKKRATNFHCNMVVERCLFACIVRV
jgi:hypothetical protein